MLINIILLFFIARFVICDGIRDYRKFPRVKRVVNGNPVLELNSEYRSVQFFVLMTDGHSGRTKCGGSLLTSTITQTACHCIATFSSSKGGYMQAQLVNVWEDFVKIYPGAVPIKTVKEVTPKIYISHPKCRKGSFRRTFYDYGLVILSKSMRGAKDRFAPVYTISTLADLFVSTQAKASVCLAVGFGRFRLMRNRSPDPAHPNEMLHGWVRVTNYHECYKLSYLQEPGKQWNYTEDATWICTKVFSNHNQRQSIGDSGGPIVCNNQLVGLVSASDFYLGKFSMYSYIYSSVMSTAFTIFENSAEYRAAFIQVFQDSDYTSILNKLSDLFNYRPTMPRIHQYHTISRSGRDLSYPNYVLVLTCAVLSLLSYTLPTAFPST